MTLEAGDYYIGDLSYVLGYADFKRVEDAEFEQICELESGSKFAKFEVSLCDFKDTQGFVYSVNSQIFGVISAGVLDEDLLDERILTHRHGRIYNKASSYPIAKIVRFNEPFVVEKTERGISVGELKLEC
ncbi:hypothetical protein [Campylobacter geochelonis]|uniref:hypothetical protein n=1 Tax=Campylobacter geochelonis TaxID=1780362 RepID=UPI0007708934|nr:hypothetical protein [Campylobacter geochelonis]CZE46631.1 Uncharacterised protein [Campylobacter geochelonis]